MAAAALPPPHGSPLEKLFEAEINVKMKKAAMLMYEQLSERHQLIVKLLSSFDSFSIGMIQGLITKNVSIGGAELTH